MTPSPIGDRAARRALAHQPVDVAVEVVVEGRRPAAGECETEHRHGEDPERGDAGRAHERRRGTAGGSRPMKVAMLTYSVKPRGGVVHALEVSEALRRRGHDVELMALARPGEGFFRPTPVRTSIVRHTPLDAPFDVRIEGMLEAYADGLRPLLGGRLIECLAPLGGPVLRTQNESATQANHGWPVRLAMVEGKIYVLR